MVFSSVIFLFLFLPIFLILYYFFALPSIIKTRNISRTLTNLFLLLSSLFFYAWGEKLMVVVMLFSTAVDYFCGLAIAGALGKGRRKPIEQLKKEGPRTAAQRFALTLSVVTNLSVLAIFKYFNFFVDNFNAAAGALGLSAWQLHDFIQVALPFGISFYTFQSMSYTIDVFRGNTTATRNFIDFSCFVTMFPQLIAGPIVRYRHVASQLIERHVNLDDFACGVRRFVVGLGKKVLLANNLAIPADLIYALPADQLTPGLAWLGTICFGLQIYFDFSGYSDMAIGLGRMLGFRFPENFDYPYISKSFTEYWTRWHITFATWFRDYLYFPLGGSRVSVPRVYLNLFTVFFLCGLWHGASWTFIIWGLTHGVFLVLERQGLGRVLERLWTPFRHAYFILVNLVMKVLFRSESFGQAMAFLSAMAGFAGVDKSTYHLGLYLNPEVMLLLMFGVVGSTPIIPAINQHLQKLTKQRSGWAMRSLETAFDFAKLAAIALVFIASAMWLATGTHNPFIYFRF